jgi:tetratricopeptide (TPR) repeat protein
MMLLYNRAIAHYAAKQYAQSADDNSRVLELKPGHSEALNNRGMARRALGDADGALADFSAAVGADKANSRALSNRAALNADLGRLAGPLRSNHKSVGLRECFGLFLSALALIAHCCMLCTPQRSG